MEIINKETMLDDLQQWLESDEFNVSNTDDESLVIEKRNLKAVMSLTANDNVIFSMSFSLKEGITEYQALNKINQINKELISGTMYIDEGKIHFSYSLVRPYGMGKIGFLYFSNYHMQLIGYVGVELGLSEIAQ